MVTIFKQDDRSYITPLELPEGKYERQQMLEYAKNHGYKVDWVKYGYRTFKAVLVPGSEGVYRTIINEEDMKQKMAQLDQRCLIPSDMGALKRCPLRVENPDYHGEDGEKKTIYNDCENCPYRDQEHRQTSAPESLSNSGELSEDGEPTDEDIPVGIAPGGMLYEKYSGAIKDYVREKYPSYYESIAMMLDGYKMKEINEKLHLNKNTVKLRIKRIRKELQEFIDNICIYD